MELNHQIRLCRPFPFLFGFRALSSRQNDQAFRDRWADHQVRLTKCS